MSNRKSMAMASFWAVLRFVSVMAKALLFVPLMLRTWDKQLYAFWVLLLSANAFYFSIFDGFIRYVSNEYNLRFYKDRQQAGAILGSGIRLLTLMAIVLLALFALLTLIWPSFTGAVLNAGAPDVTAIHLGAALLIMLTGNTCLNLARFFFPLNETVGRIWQNIQFEVWATAAEVLVLSIALFLHSNFLTAVTVSSGCYVIGSIWYVSVLIRQHKDQVPALRSGNLKQGGALLKKSMLLIVNNLTEKLSTDAYTFLLGLFSFPLLFIQQFASVRTMTNASVSGFNILQGITVPRMQEYEARGHTNDLFLLLKGIWMLIAVLLCPALILGYPLLQKAYLLWTHHRIDFSPTVFGLLMVWMFVYLYGNVLMIYLKSINRTRHLFTVTLFKTALLLGWLFLAPHAGSNMVWAFLSGDIIGGLIIYPLLVTGTGNKMPELLKYFLPMLLAIAAIACYTVNGFSLQLAGCFLCVFLIVTFICYRQVLNGIWQLLRKK
ncbi:hypothetical protein ACTHGU_05940 [Chitinophagaceae bacterium MMS25-I14]